MTKQIEELEREYLDYFSDIGYSTEKDDNLLPPTKDAGVLFMICGGIKYDKIFQGEDEGNLDKVARVQNCLRTDNDFRVGYSPRHLTNFRLLEAFSFKNTNFAEITDCMIDFLNSAGLPSEEIFLNVPNDYGEIARNAERFSGTGVEIRYLEPEELSWQIKDGLLKGQRMEIGHTPTGWELWNVAYVDPQNKALVDSGMALERLASAVNKYDSVFEIPKFESMTSEVGHRFSYLQKEDARYVADHILALNEAARQGVKPSAKGPGNKMRHLTKKVLARVRNEGPETGSVLDLLEDESFEPEVKRIEATYAKCEEEFKAYLRHNCRDYFDLENYLYARKGNSEYFDSPKLLNEEYVKITLQNNKNVVLPEVSQKELGRKYDLPLGLIKKLRK